MNSKTFLSLTTPNHRVVEREKEEYTEYVIQVFIITGTEGLFLTGYWKDHATLLLQAEAIQRCKRLNNKKQDKVVYPYE